MSACIDAADDLLSSNVLVKWHTDDVGLNTPVLDNWGISIIVWAIASYVPRNCNRQTYDGRL